MHGHTNRQLRPVGILSYPYPMPQSYASRSFLSALPEIIRTADTARICISGVKSARTR